MDPHALVGCIILAVALGSLTGLVFWSRRIINRIGKTGFGSAREIARSEDAPKRGTSSAKEGDGGG